MRTSSRKKKGESSCRLDDPKTQSLKGELVSIIMPSHNSSRFLFQSIESVLAQTYQNWELIIIDNCSIDNSVSIIEEFTNRDNRIKLIKSKKKESIAIARNRAIDAASGRYIAFLDSDDIWLPEKLERQIKFMNECGLVLSYSSYYLIDEKGGINGVFITKEIATHRELLKTCHIGNLTAIYDTFRIGKKYFEDIGHEDYALWLDILKQSKLVRGLRVPLAKYRIRDKSASSNKIKAASWQWNIYRNIERLSLIESIYYFMHYAYYGSTKYMNQDNSNRYSKDD